MAHLSVNMEDMPIQIVEEESINPLISKCQIKVCYVSDEPNRNRSVITKETAEKFAPTLRGCPIVGYYNENTGDFEMQKCGFSGSKTMKCRMNIFVLRVIFGLDSILNLNV